MDINPEHQFDLWLGKWEVHGGEDRAGTNHVTKILNEKIVREDFRVADVRGKCRVDVSSNAITNSK